MLILAANKTNGFIFCWIFNNIDDFIGFVYAIAFAILSIIPDPYPINNLKIGANTTPY